MAMSPDPFFLCEVGEGAYHDIEKFQRNHPPASALSVKWETIGVVQSDYDSDIVISSSKYTIYKY